MAASPPTLDADSTVERADPPRAAHSTALPGDPVPPPVSTAQVHRVERAVRSLQTDKWGIPLVVVIIGMFMSVLDTSIVNVAIPAMQKEYGASPDDVAWVATAYNLCLGVIVPSSAWLGERFGLRRVYLLSLLGFAFFSALCGTAGNLPIMIIWRILQAVPGGVIPVVCLSILYRLVPPQQLGAAMGLYGFGIVIAPGVGPAMGGYLVEFLNWRLIYFINVPIGIVGAVAAAFLLPNIPATPGRKFDLPGFLCVGAGLFALLLAVSEGQQWGWTSYPVLILIAASVNLFAVFVVVELNAEEPLLDVRVFRHWPFTNSLILIGVMSLGFFAILYYIPVFLQQGQNITPWHTGVALLPQAGVMMVIMPNAGRIYDRFGARWPAVTGLSMAGIGTLLMVGFNSDMSREQIIIWTMIQAGGVAVCFMPIMTAGLAALPRDNADAGNAYSNLAQRVAGALGLAAFTAMATAQQAQFTFDRSSLLGGAGASADPRIVAMEAKGPTGLIPLWEQLQVKAEAHAYSNIFMIAGIAALACVIPAFFLGRKSESGVAHVSAHMG